MEERAPPVPPGERGGEGGEGRRRRSGAGCYHCGSVGHGFWSGEVGSGRGLGARCLSSSGRVADKMNGW